MTYFDHPQLFPTPPPPPPPAPVPPKHHTALLRALVVLSVLALLGGIAVGRVTATHNSNASSPFVAPGGGFQFGGNDGGFFNGGASGGDGSSNSSNSGSTTDPNANTSAGKVSPAVVNIDTTLSQGAAAGTGMVLTSNGVVLTNNHVINGATSISVELANGSRHDASVLGYDISDDVALIRVKGVSGLPTISTSSGNVSVGDSVIALGNALGRGGAPAVVTGTVTGVHQTITASDDNGANAETLHNLIETNAPIEPGDSGGPLVDRNGRVIGMDAAASTGSGFGFRQAASSQGYAIPISQALSIAHQIQSGNETSSVHVGGRGIMGVGLDTGSNGFGFGSGGSGTNGAVVGQVESGSPADRAGIQSGDTITSVDGHSILSATDLTNVMNEHHPGDRVTVTWSDQSGNSNHARVTLESGPPA